MLAHAPEILRFARPVLDHSGDEVRYEMVDFENNIPVARQCLADGAEVILCHGGTGNAIVQALPDAAVAIARTDMDVIKTLQRAAAVARHIAFAVHEGEVHDVPEMEKLLDLRLHIVPYATLDEMRRGITDAWTRGLRVLIGGGVSSKFMESLGGVGFVIEPSTHSIQVALKRARALAAQRRLERARSADLNAIFRQVREGVVCVNSQGELVEVNQRACALLGIREADAPRALPALHEQLRLPAVLADREPRTDMLVRIGAAELLVTALPVTLHNGDQGAVALLTDVPSLQKINRKIGEAQYSRGFVARSGLDALRGDSPPMRELKRKILRLAPADAAVLITGETGTGKELVAAALHRESPRSAHPFVAINAAALPPTLLESELFGYEEGAFTGARRGGKMGLFEMAHQGTLFLDEVGEIDHALQLRLLRVLERREVMRVGGNRLIPVHVRLICATHRSLPQLAAQGAFRQDLYYRLSTLKIAVPPLRDRRSDIPAVLRPLLDALGRDASVFSPALLRRMEEWAWPGNVRELLAVVESYLWQLEGTKPDEALFEAILRENLLPLSPAGQGPPPLNPQADLRENLDAARLWYMRQAVRHCDDDRKKAARLLGISYTTLWRALQAEPQARAAGTDAAPAEASLPKAGR